MILTTLQDRNILIIRKKAKHTLLHRHSRESGNPGILYGNKTLDTRFRGYDDLLRVHHYLLACLVIRFRLSKWKQLATIEVLGVPSKKFAHYRENYLPVSGSVRKAGWEVGCGKCAMQFSVAYCGFDL
jgi:hypothetical protein